MKLHAILDRVVRLIGKFIRRPSPLDTLVHERIVLVTFLRHEGRVSRHNLDAVALQDRVFTRMELRVRRRVRDGVREEGDA